MSLSQRINLYLIITLIITCFYGIEFSYKKVDNDLQQYVNNYYKLLENYCPNKNYNTTNHYNIAIVPELNGNEIGICYRFISGYRIKISREWWDRASIDNRYQLMYHELAHCVLDKEHVEDPFNYMNAVFEYSIDKEILHLQATQDMYDKCYE